MAPEVCTLVDTDGHEAVAINGSSTPNTAPILTASVATTPPPQLLDSNQQAALEQLREQVGSLAPPGSDLEETCAFCDDAMLQRYLRARKWKVKDAAKMLQATLAWRCSYGPSQITAHDVASEAAQGNNYVHGFDKAGRPVMYIVKRDKPDSHERNVRLLVWNMELACRLMPPGTEQLCIVIDFKGYSRQNAPPLSISKLALDILANHYCERLGAAYLVNPPYIFSLLWTLLSPFVDPITRAKLHFVTADQMATPESNPLLAAIGPTNLLRRYGGGSDFEFELQAYSAAVAAATRDAAGAAEQHKL